MSNYLRSSDSDYKSYFLNDLIAQLAPLYLQRALTAKENSDMYTVTTNLSKLSEMLPEGITASQINFPPQLWLARYYILSGEEAKARQMVRSSLQVVIELLSDEHESNDEDAFKQAHFVFTAFGDEKNALTTLAMETRENRFRFRRDNGWDMLLWCDGDCGLRWRLPSEMWICKHCVNVRLDAECLAKLKEGTLARNVCNPHHEFIEVPKWDGEWLDSVPKGMVPWGDQIISLDEWKQEIRNVYIDSNA